MKKSSLLTLVALLLSSSSFAYIPTSGLTSMVLPVYGIYMSSDATCATGLTAVVPLSLTPQSLNFVTGPTIGSASTLPSTVGCVIIVMQNTFSAAWQQGTYTGTSNGNSDNIAQCNNGGTVPSQAVCQPGSGTPVWPTQITTDARALGLTLKTTACSGTLTDVVPLTLSTFSTCTGSSIADVGISACSPEVDNQFSSPSAAGDANHGVRMTAPSTAGNLKFVVNPGSMIGASSGSTCGLVAPPIFSFAAR